MTVHPAKTESARWRWHAARNVLAVRLDNLGDLLMTTPALAAVRCSLPNARLTLLTSPSGAVLAPHLPVVDEVIAFEAPWVCCPRPRGEREPAMLGQAEARMIDRLAEAAFDAAIVFTVCTQSALPAALLCRMAGIPLRLAHSRENPYELLTDWVLDTEVVGDGMRHEVERQLALVAAVGLHAQDERLRFSYAAGDAWRLRDHLSAVGLDPYKPYFVVHAGASAASRRYPAEQFGRAAEQIARESGCTAVFTGDASERALIGQARDVMTQPSASLAGVLQLGELAALIAGAQVLVSNNTGPVHIAAAVGTKVVDLYALTNPQHTPWKVSSRVLNHPVPCRNCLKSECPQGHHDCLRKVEPQAIVRASLELMGTGPAVPLNSAAMSSVLRPQPEARSQLAEAGR